MAFKTLICSLLLFAYVNCNQIKVIGYKFESDPKVNAVVNSIDEVNELLKNQDLYSVKIEGDVPTLPNNVFQETTFDGLTMQSTKLKNVEPGAFADSEVKKIDFDHNEIEVVKKGVFNGKSFERITMEENKIFYIEDGAFEGTEAESLRLNGNKLTKITEGTFGQSDIQNLVLENNHISSIEEKSFKNIENLKLLDLSTNKLENINSQFKNLDVLGSLILDKNNIKEIAPGSFEDSPIEKLYLSHNYIENLKPGIFTDTLTYINLSNNKIRNIEKGTFKDIPSFCYIHLTNNNLETFKQEYLIDTKQVQMLNLMENNMKNIEPGAFSKNRIHVLYLSENDFDVITKDMFSNAAIRNLDLGNSSIRNIEAGAFSTINGLEYLTLDNNDLREITEGMFQFSYVSEGWDYEKTPNQEMIEITLKNNLISNIQPGGLANIKVQTLVLTDNKLHTLKPKMFDDSFIKVLRLDRNAIKTIEKGTFSNLKNIYLIDLSKNQIENINGAFDNTATLREIDLSENRIKTLAPASFKNTKIDLINLKRNLLTQLSGNAFTDLDSAEILADENEIEKIDNFAGMQDIKKLSLSKNKISNIEAGTFNGIEVSTLDLSYNELRLIKNHVFTGSQITAISLEGNEIEDIEIGSFDSVAKLTFIDLDLNKLTIIKKGMFSIPLNKVSLMNNSLTTIEDGALGGLNLNSLWLENNPIADGVTFNRATLLGDSDGW